MFYCDVYRKAQNYQLKSKFIFIFGFFMDTKEIMFTFVYISETQILTV